MTDPDISVLIPAYNGRDVVLMTLRGLDRQTLPPERMDIVLIDDGSTENIADAVREAAKTMRVRVTVESQANGGAGVARNRAIGIARGRILLIINDDTIPTPGMVEAHLRLHEDFPQEEVAALGSLAISPELPDSIFLHLHHSTYYDDLPDRIDLGWRHFVTFNISAKASLLRASGGFDSGLRWHEDDELGLRLSQRGLRVLFAKDALGHHYHPMNEAGYFRIADRDGESLAQMYNRTPSLLPMLVELGLHSARLGTAAPRHRLADIAINRATYPLWLALARALTDRQPQMAMTVYRKLFQWRRRRATEAGLLSGDLPTDKAGNRTPYRGQEIGQVAP
jgi:GT2 family glycosyltransferase